MRAETIEIVNARMVASRLSSRKIEGTIPIIIRGQRPVLEVDIRNHGADLEDVRLVWKVWLDDDELLETNLSTWKKEKPFSIANRETYTYECPMKTMTKSLKTEREFSLEGELRCEESLCIFPRVHIALVGL